MKLIASLQLTQAEVAVNASRYTDKLEDKILSSVDHVGEQGFLSKLQFQQLCECKSPRIQSRVQVNSEESIVNTTKLALGTQDIRLSVHVLKALWQYSTEHQPPNNN
jgi:hypothetical protein